MTNYNCHVQQIGDFSHFSQTEYDYDICCAGAKAQTYFLVECIQPWIHGEPKVLAEERGVRGQQAG